MGSKYIHVGQIGKSFGTDGFCRIKLFDEHLENIIKQTFLFVNHDEYYVPYRVIEWRSKHSLVRFDDINNQASADDIQSLKIFLPLSEVDVQEKITYGLEGFTLFDGERLIGKIEYLQEMPQQLLAMVIYNNKEIFIPIHESLIDELVPEEKRIVMDLPEGLTEL